MSEGSQILAQFIFDSYNGKVLGAQKSFLGSTTTIDFLKKCNLSDLTKEGGGSHIDPSHLGTIRPLDTIPKLTIYLWPNVKTVKPNF